MTTATEPNAIRKNIWINIIFFIITTGGTVVGLPLYISRYGISQSEIILALFFVVMTGLSITVGYHRLFSHAAFKANKLIRFLMLFFGAAAFEQPLLMWASQHRDHHRYVDTELDPYSIKKGFFYAHMGWLIFWEHKIHYENVKDLQQDPMVMHQFKYYALWSIGAGIIFPVILGALTGHALGAFLLSVCARITLVYHSTFCINSVCHMFGTSTYDINATAKDHWLVALITFGEGYHNFHHRFPSDYRNGVRWYHWDPSKWFIALLGMLGMAWDLKRVSYFKILEARLAAQNTRVRSGLEKMPVSVSIAAAREAVKAEYQKLAESLSQWEMAAREQYHVSVGDALKEKAARVQSAAKAKTDACRKNFKILHDRWLQLIKIDSALLAAGGNS